MKIKKIEVKNERLLFAILLIALFIIFILYYNFVFSEVFARNSFANQMIEIAINGCNGKMGQVKMKIQYLVFKEYCCIVVQMQLIIQMIYL